MCLFLNNGNDLYTIKVRIMSKTLYKLAIISNIKKLCDAVIEEGCFNNDVEKDMAVFQWLQVAASLGSKEAQAMSENILKDELEDATIAVLHYNVAKWFIYGENDIIPNPNLGLEQLELAKKLQLWESNDIDYNLRKLRENLNEGYRKRLDKMFPELMLNYYEVIEEIDKAFEDAIMPKTERELTNFNDIDYKYVVRHFLGKSRKDINSLYFKPALHLEDFSHMTRGAIEYYLPPVLKLMLDDPYEADLSVFLFSFLNNDYFNESGDKLYTFLQQSAISNWAKLLLEKWEQKNWDEDVKKAQKLIQRLSM